MSTLIDPGLVEHRLEHLFRHRLQLEVPTSRTDIVDSGLLDSVAFVNLIVGIEREFGLRVPVEEIELDDFRTIAGIAAYLVRRAARE